MRFDEISQFKYISVQPRIGGLDEVQQFALSYCSDCHLALSGPPGVGKTMLVDEFAAKIGKKLVSRVMGPKVNESLLISYPDLISRNGASVTVTRPGLLAKALKKNCFYFADEIDRLTEDNQKLHNSAFDDRRSVTLRDGTVIKGGNGFFGVVAYNPTQGTRNDLDSSLADRFVHINFDYYPPEVQSMIAMRQAGLHDDSLENKLSWKALFLQSEPTKSVQFFDVEFKKKSIRLFDPYRDKSMDLSHLNAETYRGKLFVYLRYDPGKAGHGFIEPYQHNLNSLSLKLAEFCSDIRGLVTHGIRNLSSEIVSQFHESSSPLGVNAISLHIPSSRIQQAALKQYNYLIKRLEYPKGKAQEYAAYLIINQAGYGKFGTSKAGSSTQRDLLISLAGAKSLLPMRKQRVFAPVKSGKSKGIRKAS